MRAGVKQLTFGANMKREIRSMREQEPRKPGGPAGHSRRDFLRGSGVAAATAVLTGQATLALDEAEAAQAEPEGPLGHGRHHAQGQRRRIARARSSRAARCSTRCGIGWT